MRNRWSKPGRCIFWGFFRLATVRSPMKAYCFVDGMRCDVQSVLDRVPNIC
jgi:hypothetical protein